MTKTNKKIKKVEDPACGPCQETRGICIRHKETFKCVLTLKLEELEEYRTMLNSTTTVYPMNSTTTVYPMNSTITPSQTPSTPPPHTSFNNKLIGVAVVSSFAFSGILVHVLFPVQSRHAARKVALTFRGMWMFSKEKAVICTNWICSKWSNSKKLADPELPPQKEAVEDDATVSSTAPIVVDNNNNNHEGEPVEEVENIQEEEDEDLQRMAFEMA